jgi:hypothetical protein
MVAVDQPRLCSDANVQTPHAVAQLGVRLAATLAQAAEEARSALSAEQAKTLKLETQVAELTDKLNSVQVGLLETWWLGCMGAPTQMIAAMVHCWWLPPKQTVHYRQRGQGFGPLTVHRSCPAPIAALGLEGGSPGTRISSSCLHNFCRDQHQQRHFVAARQ